MFSNSNISPMGLIDPFRYKNSKNNLVNLYTRDLGLLSPLKHIRETNSRILDEIKLSKNRSIQSSSYSINWFDLDNVENR